MHPQSPTRYLKKLSDHCGLPDRRPHKLRHTFASVAITNGADVANVSEALGHSDKAVTLQMYQRRELIVGQTAETGVLPHVESLTAALEPHAGQQDFDEFDMRHSAASEATLVAVEGSVSAVQAAAEAGKAAAAQVGPVKLCEVIARPHPQIMKFLRTDPV